MKKAAQPGAGGDSSLSKPIAGGYDPRDFGRFLEKCHLCNKRIANNSEVFMYGDMRGFCSAECRDRQILGDQSANIRRRNPK